MVTPGRIVNLITVLIGVIFCLASFRLGIGNPNSPGPGFLPFLVGIILIVLSTAVILEERHSTGSGKTAPLFNGKRSVVALSVLASLFAYSFFLDILGFLLATFLLLLFLFRVSEKQNWKMVVGTALLTTIVSYVLFDHFLQITFPVGVFGF